MLQVFPAGQCSMLLRRATDWISAVGPLRSAPWQAPTPSTNGCPAMTAVRRGGCPVPGTDVGGDRPDPAGVAPVARIDLVPAVLGVDGGDAVDPLVHFGEYRCRSAACAVPASGAAVRARQNLPAAPGATRSRSVSFPRTPSAGWPSSCHRRCWGRRCQCRAGCSASRQRPGRGVSPGSHPAGTTSAGSGRSCFCASPAMWVARMFSPARYSTWVL